MASLTSPNTHCFEGYACLYAAQYTGGRCQQAFDQLWDNLHGDPERREAAQPLLEFAELNPCPKEVQKEIQDTIEFERARLDMLTKVINSEIVYDFETDEDGTL